MSSQAWTDPFKSWRRDMEKRLAAGQDVTVDLLAGAQLILEARERAAGADVERLQGWASALRRGDGRLQKCQIALEGV